MSRYIFIRQDFQVSRSLRQNNKFVSNVIIAIQVEAIFFLVDVKICHATLLGHVCPPREPRAGFLIKPGRVLELAAR